MISVGQMSGTSLDGIDIAIIEATPKEVIRRIGWHFEPYPSAIKTEVLKCIEAFKRGEPDEYDTQTLVNTLTDLNSQTIETALNTFNLSNKDIDLIGYHGQTVWHDPTAGSTVQLGDGQRLADNLKINTVYDFRSNDINHGGQGAPLAPLYHKVLFGHLEQPSVILNIGGVGNLSYIDGDELIAFDYGPGNALIDDAMRVYGLGEYDKDGAIAASGFASTEWIEQFLKNAYFTKAWPKSLDRNAFADEFSELMSRRLSVEDTIASVTKATALTVKKAVEQLPKTPKHWVVCGGGRHNPTLIQSIADLVELPIYSSDAYGINGDAIEAEAFAYLAILSSNGEPISLPSTTGCDVPCSGGTLVKV